MKISEMIAELEIKKVFLGDVEVIAMIEFWEDDTIQNPASIRIEARDHSGTTVVAVVPYDVA